MELLLCSLKGLSDQELTVRLSSEVVGFFPPVTFRSAGAGMA